MLNCWDIDKYRYFNHVLQHALKILTWFWSKTSNWIVYNPTSQNALVNLANTWRVGLGWVGRIIWFFLLNNQLQIRTLVYIWHNSTSNAHFGPQMSMLRRPTLKSKAARATASWAKTVLFLGFLYPKIHLFPF